MGILGALKDTISKNCDCRISLSLELERLLTAAETRC